MRTEKHNKGKMKWNELNWKTQNSLRKLNNLLFLITHSQTFGNEELTLQNCKNCCATESDLHVAVCIRLSPAECNLLLKQSQTEESIQFIVSDFEKLAN